MVMTLWGARGTASGPLGCKWRRQVARGRRASSAPWRPAYQRTAFSCSRALAARAWRATGPPRALRMLRLLSSLAISADAHGSTRARQHVADSLCLPPATASCRNVALVELVGDVTQRRNPLTLNGADDG